MFGSDWFIKKTTHDYNKSLQFINLTYYLEIKIIEAHKLSEANKLE